MHDTSDVALVLVLAGCPHPVTQPKPSRYVRISEDHLLMLSGYNCAVAICQGDSLFLSLLFLFVVCLFDICLVSLCVLLFACLICLSECII